MKRLARLILAAAVAGLVAAYFLNHQRDVGSANVEVSEVVPAPAAVEDLSAVTGLGEVPTGAVVFDLKYRGATGAKDDIEYRSFYGYGGVDGEKSGFVDEVQKQARHITRIRHYSLGGRPWSALEHEGLKVAAFYFDLNDDGHLTDNERIRPTRVEGSSVEFITPDFRLRPGVGTEPHAEVTMRVLLRADFYGRGDTPSFMWSPACVLDGQATLSGKAARLILFSDGFEGGFDRFGRGYYALMPADEPLMPGRYIGREMLSSLVQSEGKYYRLRLDGKRSSGHPARAVLTPDASAVGGLSVRLEGRGTNVLYSSLDGAYLEGVQDRTVYLRLANGGAKLPVGAYRVTRGDINYGSNTQMDWHVGFSGGGEVRIGGSGSDPLTDMVLGHPSLAIRVVREEDRYQADAKETTKFSKGTKVYIEPRITCRDGAVLTRFARLGGGSGGGRERQHDVEPRLQVANVEGKELLAQKMEYG